MSAIPSAAPETVAGIAADDNGVIRTTQRDDLTARAAEFTIRLAGAGPVSDAFIASVGSMDLLNGPVGSGKTTALPKRAVASARGMPPMADGARAVRRYELGMVRKTYDELWSTTIRSWKKIFDWEKGVGAFSGTRGRSAAHTLMFDDGYGLVELRVDFHSFGEFPEPDDFKGFEWTDVCLNEWTTLPEVYTTNLIGRVGRAPLPEGEIGRPGRLFGDCNAPDVLNYLYRDFFDIATRKPGYVLFRQPGGRAPNAENPSLGRSYYERLVADNAHRPWWIKTMVDNKPGFNRDGDAIYPRYDDDVHCSLVELAPMKDIPIVVGIDGGLTPACVYQQETPNGDLRVLAEITLERGDETDLATSMLAYELRRFRDCEFYDVIDPAAGAGEDVGNSSVRARMAKALGRPVRLAQSNDPQERWDAIRRPLDRRGGYLIDALHCPALRRGFSQTYCYTAIRGTNERRQAMKGADSHVHDAAQYAAMEAGEAHSRKRRTELDRERGRKRQRARAADRYDPFARGA